MADLIRKQVIFNPADPFHAELHEFSKRYPNFSGYVRRLIQRDMEGGRALPIHDAPTPVRFTKEEAEGWV